MAQVLHRTALHCTAPHCTALHRTALHRTAPYCTALQGQRQKLTSCVLCVGTWSQRSAWLRQRHTLGVHCEEQDDLGRHLSELPPEQPPCTEGEGQRRTCG